MDIERDKALQLGSMTTPAWPVAFARLRVGADEFIQGFPCNHIHGVYGNWVDELETVARILDIPVQLMGGRDNGGKENV